MKRKLLSALLLSSAPLFAQTVQAPETPSFPSGTMVANLPWSQKSVDFGRAGYIHTRMSINGGPTESFTVDTGSVGIVVGAVAIPGFDPSKGTPGEIAYSSSGRHEIGYWVMVDLAFPDATLPNGKPVTAKVEVLAVTKITCDGKGVNAAKCTDDSAPNPHMMGIGFGRGPAEHFDAQLHNPFVNIHEMLTGQMRRGYVLTPTGIQLGLNKETVGGKDWIWQKLKKRDGVTIPEDYSGPADWDTAAGSFAIGTASGKFVAAPMGTVLIDTGLTNLILRSELPNTGDLPAGTPVRIDLLGGKASYKILAGDKSDPAAPSKTSLLKSSSTFVNTGMHALAKFDYCYDADGGYLGLKPRP